jgi:hypothetical protein
MELQSGIGSRLPPAGEPTVEGKPRFPLRPLPFTE